MKKWTAYIIYGLSVLLIFLYLLFPSGPVKQFIVRQVEAMAPALVIQMDDIAPSIPPGLTVNNLQVALENGSVFRVPRLTLTPAYLSLFSTRKVFNLKGVAYEGAVNGQTAVENASRPNYSADVVFEAVELDKIDALTELMPHHVSGVASGHIQYETKTGNFGQGDAEATIKECRVQLNAPIFGFESLTVGTVNAVLELKGDTAELRHIRIKGRQVTGNASGVIELRRPLNKSTLQLTGTIKPHPSFIKELGQAVPSQILSMGNYVEKGVPFRISGTLERPKISLR